MSNESSTLSAMLEQFKTVNEPKQQSTNKVPFNKKNYFNPYLEDGEDSKQYTIRILPTTDNSSPFKEVYIHTAKVDGINKKFPCLKHLKDEDCPFCEARNLLLATGDENDKELAKSYREKKTYTLKVIDRSDESHGPKFWRFNESFKKDGSYDKIMAIVNALKEDITNPETGRDLVLSVQRVPNNRGGTYPSVNGIMQLDKSPLHVDEDVKQSWVNDDKVWTDVFSVKSYDYLSIVVKGQTPVWDKESSMYVAKEEQENQEETVDYNESLEQELTIGQNSQNDLSNTETTVTEDDDVDDLPF